MANTYTKQFSIFVVLTVLAFSPLFMWFQQDKDVTVLVAAGQQTSQSYAILQAISQVVHEYYPNITLEIIETRGAKQNAQLLDKGLVQMATVQAEKIVGTSPRLIASLYPDTYQLLVHKGSGIRTFEDLRGKSIALAPKGSGEYEAFWTVANYFGLKRDAVDMFTATDSTTDWIFTNHEVDAIFRVRSPGDASIAQLAAQTQAQFVNIEQAEGFRIHYPSREASSIPKGAYNGSPALPNHNVESIAERQLLIARNDVDPVVVEQITSILFDKRQELIALVAMAGLIAQPQENSEQLIPIHDGVRQFWDRAKPSFLQENADAIAAVLSLGVIFASILFRFVSNQRQRIMFSYNRRLMNMALDIKSTTDKATLEQYSIKFDRFMLQLLDATEKGEISADDYKTLNFTFDVVNSALADKRANLTSGAQ